MRFNPPSASRAACVGALALLALLGCSSAPQPAPATAAPDATPVELPPGGLIEAYRVVTPDAPIPAFRVQATSGEIFDSKILVEEGPVVLVFFASWCERCREKLPEIADILSAAPDGTTVFGISLDDSETFHQVPAFVREYDFEYPVVAATRFPQFTLAFDPLQLVPVVVVVGRDAQVVDFQLGTSPDHPARLELALKLAREGRPTKSEPELRELELEDLHQDR